MTNKHKHAEMIKAKADNAKRERDRLVEENKRLWEVVIYLSRSKQYSEVDSHYRLDALVSLANRTLKELDGKK